MKNIKYILLVFMTSCFVNAQSSISSSTQEPDENNTVNNNTSINLFTINYNGDQIPIILSYSHDGIKVGEKPSSALGMKWKIENIGYINRIVNYLTDSFTTGWFNSQDPSFESATWSTLNPTSENDLSPDFFSASIINGVNFDFFYKKNIQNGVIGLPIPEFLSNPDGYKINTNFSNFTTSCAAPTNNIVFNILDKIGNNYNFVNGPTLIDQNRGFYNNCRTNFYLKSITNPYNSDYLTIDYISKIINRQKSYSTGLNSRKTIISCPSQSPDYYLCLNNNYDYDNYIVQKTGSDYYEVDESRFDIQKITTNKEIIDFIYTSDLQYLKEIKISDLKNNHITSYYFSYQNFTGTSIPTLVKINKDISLTQQSPVLYQFEYYTGGDWIGLNTDVGGPYANGEFEDYFGYYNGQSKQSMYPLPLPVRSISDGSIISPPDFEPNASMIKEHSLYRIKNKFGGITEFDYQIKSGIDSFLGKIHGGGLVISSKKELPITGKSTLIKYDYQDLTGFVIATDHLVGNYLKTVETTSNYQFYSAIPNLVNSEDTPPGQGGWASVQKNGSFFKNITESIYDLDDMSLKSKTIRQFTSNYEGVNRAPLLVGEIFKNSSDVTVKTVDYIYDYQNIATINSAEFSAEKRDFLDGGARFYITKANRPIQVNRIKLIQKKEKYYTSQSITNDTYCTYLNSNTQLLRNKYQTTALGDNIEERYYYPQDIGMASEPFVSELIAKNISIPIKTETYRNSEKLSEQKTVYAKDATTSNLLKPKYVYAKKGTDANSTLEKKMTFDSYDDKGNLTQYTTENGMQVSIIWGYDKTQQIAKIENTAYSSITASLITTAQTKSNTGTEAELLTALTAIRNSLPNAMMTSYTYKPLIGISSVTDPKGDKIIYNYDSLNRLLNVKDKNGNILSENEYQFAPQN